MNDEFYKIREIGELDVDFSLFETIKSLKKDYKGNHEHARKMIRQINKSPFHFIYGAFLNEPEKIGSNIGMIRLIIDPKFYGPCRANGQDLCVRKPYQGKGIRTDLLDFAEGRAKKMECDRFYGEVKEDMVSFYLDKGWELKDNLMVKMF